MVELHWGVGSSAGVFLLLIVGEFPGIFALIAGEFPGIFALIVGEFPLLAEDFILFARDD